MKYLIFENNKIKQIKILTLIFLFISKTLNNGGTEDDEEKIHLFDKDGLEITDDKGNKGFPYIVIKDNKEKIPETYLKVSENGVEKTVVSPQEYPLNTQDNKIIISIEENGLSIGVVKFKEGEEKAEKIFSKLWKKYKEKELLETFFLKDQKRNKVKFKDKTLEFKVMSRIKFFSMKENFTTQEKSVNFTNEEGKILFYEIKEDKIIFYLKKKIGSFVFFLEEDFEEKEEEKKNDFGKKEIILLLRDEQNDSENLDEKEVEIDLEKGTVKEKYKTKGDKDFNICKCCCEGCCKNKEEI